MKVFVTGGSGFIGRFVLKDLKKRGHKILLLSREDYREPGIKTIKGDLSDIDSWANKLKAFKPDAAIHLAWEGIPDYGSAMSVKNLIRSIALLDVLARVGCRKVIVAGTCFEYGDRIGAVDETMPVNPKDPFTAAKHALHIVGEQISKESGMEFVWVRPFYVYGEGQRSGSLIPYITRCARENLPLKLKTPLARNDFVYISDVASGIVSALARGKAGQTYNLGSGKLTSVKDIARLVYTGLGKGDEYKKLNSLFKGKPSGGFYADLSKSKRELGWRPKVTIEQGIRNII